MLSFSSNSRTFPTYHVTFGIVALDIFELYRKKLLSDTRQVLSHTTFAGADYRRGFNNTLENERDKDKKSMARCGGYDKPL